MSGCKVIIKGQGKAFPKVLIDGKELPLIDVNLSFGVGKPPMIELKIWAYKLIDLELENVDVNIHPVIGDSETAKCIQRILETKFNKGE